MAALDYLETLSYVDKDALYIAGGSFGGATAQVTASKRNDELAGLIVLQGAFSDDNASMYGDYETLKDNPYSAGEVLFVQGTEDQQCLLSRSIDNMTWYPQCSLTAISRTGHGYGYQTDRSTLTTIDSMLEFMNRTRRQTEE